jgi:uncharacterized protein (TIRG00374 family)
MRRVTLLRWLRVALGLGLLGLLLKQVRKEELLALVRHGDTKQLGLALALLFFANPLLQTLRLHVLVARYTQNLATTFEVFSVGAFFNTMLPSNVGGDAVKLLYLKRMRAESWGGPFALLMLHRVTGMLVLLLGAAIHALFSRARLSALLSAAHVEASAPLRVLPLVAALCLLGLLAWLLLSRRQRQKISGFLRRFASECGEALRQLSAQALIGLLLLTLAFHGVRLFAFYMLVAYAGQHIELLDLLIVLAATAVAGVVPISVGGLGLMEGAISIMLGLFGVAPSAAIVAALANRLILLASAAIGGVIYVTSRGSKSRGHPL